MKIKKKTFNHYMKNRSSKFRFANFSFLKINFIFVFISNSFFNQLKSLFVSNFEFQTKIKFKSKKLFFARFEFRLRFDSTSTKKCFECIIYEKKLIIFKYIENSCAKIIIIVD